jgi:hypothetical protein
LGCNWSRFNTNILSQSSNVTIHWIYTIIVSL